MPDSNPLRWFDRLLRRRGDSSRARATVEAELAEARGDLARAWPNEEAGMSLDQAPSADARNALQRVIRLQKELDSLD